MGRVNEKMDKLREVHLRCPSQNVSVPIGSSHFKLPKVAISTGGDWLSVDYATPNAALRMCTDKVKSFLPE